MRFEISEVMQQDAVMELVYGNCDRPKELLGRHLVSNGQVISAFHPDAVSMEVIDQAGNHYPMDPVERQPVYAVFLADRKAFSYQIQMVFRDGNTYVSEDPYLFEGAISSEDTAQLAAGTWKNAYRKLGSHVDTVDGVSGVRFALWAPIARRVSLVGDFNYWNGMIYPMQRVGNSGLFELFIPGVHAGQLYKYEIKTWQGRVIQRTDPYAVMNEKQEGGASVIMDLEMFRWNDSRFMAGRTIRDIHSRSLSLCEMFEPELMFPEERLREIVIDMGLSHILLKNKPDSFDIVSEELAGIIDKESGKTAAKGFFEPMYSRSSPDRTRAFVNECHRNRMSVLIEISNDYIQRAFDYILEFTDSREERITEGLEKLTGLTGYRYLLCRSPELFNYILSNLIFWIRKYHIDGFVFHGFRDRLASVAEGTEDPDISGQDWKDLIQRHYDLVEDLMKAVREGDPGILFIGDCIRQGDFFADDRWVSGLKKPSYDLEWNYTVKTKLDRYLEMSREERKLSHWMLSLPLMRMDGTDSLLLLNQEWKKAKSLRDPDPYTVADEKLAYAFLTGMPGKKAWALHANQHTSSLVFARALLKLYNHYAALSEYDSKRVHFEWINAVDADQGVLSFVRTDPRGRDHLLFVCNFDSEEKKGYRLGLPGRGIYRMILNSDSPEYGGEGKYEGQEYQAEAIACDLREYSMKVYLPARSALIFHY